MDRELHLGTALAAIGALAAAALPARADGEPARVTAVAGEARAGTTPLTGSEMLAEGSSVETAADSSCALLVDASAVVELCGSTRVGVGLGSRGQRVVRVEAGTVRLVVEPRDRSERIEIHTPAAIATLLGTIVHVEVDPATGRTSIASSESRVRVASSDPARAGATLLGPGEHVRLDVGEAPPRRPERLAPRALAELGACLVDLRRAASHRDARRLSADAADLAALLDGLELGLDPDADPGDLLPAGIPDAPLGDPGSIGDLVPLSGAEDSNLSTQPSLP